MEKYKLHFDQIEQIDVEITGVCNLKCPICLSQAKKLQCNFHYLDLNQLISVIKKMKKLNNIYIAGDYSEPTLHPDLFILLDFLKTQLQIKTNLFTNASCHDKAYWRELNKHFNSNSQVIFTICGSTQELHEKYRVGSDLNTVIQNALEFKKGNIFNNDYMQYIQFEYNKHDNIKDILSILKKFSNYEIIKTNMLYERFNPGKINKNKICASYVESYLYQRKINQILKKSNKDIHCFSFYNKLLKIDNYLNFYPCVCWEFFNKMKKENFFIDDEFDYDKIFKNEFNFCYECDKEMLQYLIKNKISTFYAAP